MDFHQKTLVFQTGIVMILSFVKKTAFESNKIDIIYNTFSKG